MSLNASDLAAAMLGAAKEKLSDKWPDIKDYASIEAEKIARDILWIERMRAEGKITQKRAKLHMKMAKNNSKIVLLTIEGLGIIAVEEAINAAVGVLKESVNEALGFALI